MWVRDTHQSYFTGLSEHIRKLSISLYIKGKTFQVMCEKKYGPNIKSRELVSWITEQTFMYRSHYSFNMLCCRLVLTFMIVTSSRCPGLLLICATKVELVWWKGHQWTEGKGFQMNAFHDHWVWACLSHLLIQGLSDGTSLRPKDILQSFSVRVSGHEESMSHTAKKVKNAPSFLFIFRGCWSWISECSATAQRYIG